MDNFDFINNPHKIEKLKQANTALRLDNIEEKFKHNNIIFVYSMPKVGSTSLVSSLRLFAFFSYIIIHIHDEEMLEVLAKINDITIIEIINYNGHLKRNVFVVDIYRSPIEHKISTFFEKIDTYHFNTNFENINNYNSNRLIQRFNNIFPHLANGDHFIDKYNINEITNFDFEQKYMFYPKNNIKYLKLRLNDVSEWRNIINKFFNVDVIVVNDYSSSNKNIKLAYNNFKNNYKIPNNFLEDIKNNKYFNFYYSQREKDEYINFWKNKVCYDFKPMDENEYKLYNSITLENQAVNKIDTTHYMYNGCICKACLIKRGELIIKLKEGKQPNIKIIHEEAVIELNNDKRKNIGKIIQKINENGGIKIRNFKSNKKRQLLRNNMNYISTR